MQKKSKVPVLCVVEAQNQLETAAIVVSDV